MQDKIGTKVFVHIGPHRTGSTAIQHFILTKGELLAAHGVSVLHTHTTHEAAKLFAGEDHEAAARLLAKINDQIARVDTPVVLLSQEDFCGPLPGRTRARLIYPKLMRNLRLIARALAPHEVSFIFYEREVNTWLQSCYHQNLRYRTQFSSMQAFRDHFREMPDWTSLLERPRAVFKERLVVLPYDRNPAEGVRRLLDTLGIKGMALAGAAEIKNSSPGSDELRILERVNALSAFPGTAWFAKSLLCNGWRPRVTLAAQSNAVAASWETAEEAFPDLARRAKGRIAPQGVEDILPDPKSPLEELAFRILPGDAELPTGHRADIRVQARILDYHFRGKSELARLNALAISYLRRDTNCTDKAREIFHKIWDNHAPLLINELGTRWLISTLQTFLDHGKNEQQRLIGACGYFYANLVKIYEGERALDGLEPDALIRSPVATTRSKFRGLDRYRIGGTDLLLNVNALALDISTRDAVAGLVLQEFLLRVKDSGNAFTRVDQTRKALGIVEENFEDTWSFFVEPRG